MFVTLLSGAGQGLIWAVLALGVYISFRLLDFADLTCEGSITCGAAVAATVIYKGGNVYVALLLAFIAGLLAGMVTGLLHTKLKIPPILAGIISMISLYSVNIHIMSIGTGSSGTGNLSLLNSLNKTLYIGLNNFFKLNNLRVTTLLVGIVICGILIALLYWFFGTSLGSTIRATGDNEKMCRAQGINTDLTKILGLALSNGLIALAGGLLCNNMKGCNVNMGTGAIVIGLASIIIGESLFRRLPGFAWKLVGIVVGAVIYRVVVTYVIYFGVPTDDLKIMTAAVVVVALSFGTFKKPIENFFKKTFAKKASAQAVSAPQTEETAEISDDKGETV